MPAPAFQFYPGDWMRNAKLQRCTFAAQGAWIGVMCLMHDSDAYGTLNWPLKEVARVIGCPLSLLRELIDKDVLKGSDAGCICKPYIYTPRSGRKDGKPVVLVPETPGPIWYSSRMVRDDYLRRVRGASTRFTAEEDVAPMASPKGGIGDDKDASPALGQGDGSSSASATAKKNIPTTSAETIFGWGVEFLRARGADEKHARSTIGLVRKKLGELRCLELLQQAEREQITDPIPWLMKATQNVMNPSRPPPRQSIADRAAAAVQLAQEIENAQRS